MATVLCMLEAIGHSIMVNSNSSSEGGYVVAQNDQCNHHREICKETDRLHTQFTYTHIALAVDGNAWIDALCINSFLL